MMTNFYKNLDYYIPNPKCELNYNTDYELLIATVLSANSTDKVVNKVTKDLFENYDIFSLATADIDDLKEIIKRTGNYNRRSVYLKEIAKRVVDEWGGIIPNDRTFLESLPGVGHKTANVVLKNIFNEPCIPVDTHVRRVTIRLGLVIKDASVIEVEEALMKWIPEEKWARTSEQLLLFGRYHCKSVKPLCDGCLFSKECKKDI